MWLLLISRRKKKGFNYTLESEEDERTKEQRAESESRRVRVE